MKIINRQLQSLIVDCLHTFPAVYINGPRQAGKTTLVRQLLAQTFAAKFITFDDALETAAAMRNPYSYLKNSGSPLIIDEVQMVPALFRPLKKIIDEERHEALIRDLSANGHYLLTGSANLLALPELADAMVGRMATLTLLPLSVSEIQNRSSSFLERCFLKDFSEIIPETFDITQLMRMATFPELSYLSKSMTDAWFKNYIQKIILDDPKHLYSLEKAEYMPILLQLLAARAGGLINDAELGRELGLNAVTTRHYRGLLSNTFVMHALKPWYRNITKRLVKAHKIYFYDTLLLCHVLKSDPETLLKNQPHRFGHILENFVFSELQKANCFTSEQFDISFYRTNDGKEVDFILEKENKLIAIEVKHAENITERDLSGIRELQQAIGKDFHCGIVLCNTPRVIPYDDNLYLLPFSVLWQ
jgi:predicted AAA+ superfamily ATPase